MSVRELFIILNPAADRGRAKKVGTEIEAALRSWNADYRIVETRSRGHAIELAQQGIEEGWPGLVAVGGDGIVHETVNGMMASGVADLPPLGVVAVGSGNDFVKMLELPRHAPTAAIQRILRAEPRRVDVGRVAHFVGTGGPPGIWYFTNGIGLGFDAQIAVNARKIQRLRGLAIYGWAVMKTLRELRTPHIRVEVDGRTIADGELILTTVSNGPCHGGSFWLCPGARLDDEQLDILTATARPMPSVLRLIPSVMRGSHIDHQGVELHRGRRVSVRSDFPLPIHADGEIVADAVYEIEMEVVAGGLPVLA